VIARRAYKCLQLSCCKPTSLTDGASRLVFVSEAKVLLFGSVLEEESWSFCHAVSPPYSEARVKND
jgi:hypothetical protein